MEFSNLFFLYLFFPLCAGIYFLAPGMKLKNGGLILFSLLFYSCGRPAYVPLLLFLTAVNYVLPKAIKSGSVALVLNLIVNIGILTFFKLYHRISFPMGLSFYCFSLIAYGVDVFKHPEEECKNFWQFLLFIGFFPKMLMGPILRYSQISPQLKNRAVDPKGIFHGALRFTVGLGKKVLLADPLFRVYEQLGNHSAWLAPWGAGLAFMLYIYLEFSGYGDMTLGLGQIFGFRLPENFHRPYTAESVGDFWRRWHISLGSFFRDYVYIPMGGNRKGFVRQIVNLFTVWILTGLWHGITWTFFLWGMYFFLLLWGEKLFSLGGKKVPKGVGKILTFVLVFFGWVIFAAKDIPSLGNTIVRMFSFAFDGLEPTLLVLFNSGPLLLLSFVVSVPGPAWKDIIKSRIEKASPIGQTWIVVGQGLMMIGLLVLCTISLMGTAARPSMYGAF